MAMPTSTANWHWKNKNITPWTRTWLERELLRVIIGADGAERVAVTNVDSVEGDAELGQRKSKLITIYDCKVVLAWEGTASDGTEVKGTLTIPEVSHEQLDGLEDYTYEWVLTTASAPAVNALYARAKREFPAALEAVFAELPRAMLDTHGKDLLVQGGASQAGVVANTTTASSISTPGPGPSATAAAAAPSPKVPANKSAHTAVVRASATFMAAADDLFSLLTDAARIPMWTRAPATSAPEKGGAYTLFGGGVRGTYVELDRPKRFVQTWALQNPSWPSGHEATLTTTLDQSSDSTTVSWALAGVPTGMEDEITRNIEGYYVHGLKSIGYVQLIRAPPPRTSSVSPPLRTQAKARGTAQTEPDADAVPPPPQFRAVSLGIAGLVLLAAFVPYFLS